VVLSDDVFDDAFESELPLLLLLVPCEELFEFADELAELFEELFEFAELFPLLWPLLPLRFELLPVHAERANTRTELSRRLIATP
jgi:hypothetical protein